MCTLTWLREPAGYRLFSNRDEKLSRPCGAPPRIHERNGIRFLAPVDTLFGGTWIAVNEFGIAMSILNGPPGTIAATSRGLLVWEMSIIESQRQVLALLQSIGLGQFAPFTLAVFEPHRKPVICGWTGKRLSIIPASFPLASSSADYAGVRAARRKQVAGIGPISPAALHRFHASHDGGPSAYSPCMHREDAQTVSYTELMVSSDRIRMTYQPGPPCEHRQSNSITLPRRT